MKKSSTSLSRLGVFTAALLLIFWMVLVSVALRVWAGYALLVANLKSPYNGLEHAERAGGKLRGGVVSQNAGCRYIEVGNGSKYLGVAHSAIGKEHEA